ncbi:MAG: NADH-quinone oxidoreductase subunit L [Cytophagales bacterium]
MTDFIFIVPLLPLIGFIINGLFGKKMPKSLVGVIGTSVMALAFALVVSIFFTTEGQNYRTLYSFIDTPYLKVPFEFLVDPLSITMMLIITGIGTLIHLYSTSYMHDDEGFYRFFAYLNLFVFFMLLLVLGANYVIMFIGWEGVGLCSYLLIGFWFKNQNYNDAAKKAFIVNRVGDLGFLLGMFLLMYVTKSDNLNYKDVFSFFQNNSVETGTVTVITLLLFIGATGKSAQLPLYVWLPDAMAGPTPVSALIHAATMVTAGIYMIVRSNILFLLSPETMMVISVVGIATALFAATIGLFQNDIKKVLAYSTVSQLGYMFLGLGVGAFTSGLFHVMTHAFFKALLFLGAGSVIHAMHHEQDIRNMGGLSKKLPITHLTFLIGCLAIAGIPLFSGFFSKDEILAHAFAKSPILWALGVLGAVMTAFYMFRLYFLTFKGKFRGTHEQEHHLHESPFAMTLPLIILAILSIAGGYLNIGEIFHGNAALENYLKPVFMTPYGYKPETHVLSHSTEYILMGISVSLVIVSIISAFVIYGKGNNVPSEDSKIGGFVKLVYNKYYVDELYDLAIVKPLYFMSSVGSVIIDNKIIDGIVNLFGSIFYNGSNYVRRLQSGNISLYLLVMVLGSVLLLALNFVVK